MNNKGFSLLEMLLTMMLISSLSLLALKNYSFIDLSHLDFLNDYLISQNEALTNRQTIALNNHDIYFYPSGRVNRANTIKINNHKIIIHLGNGHIAYE